MGGQTENPRPADSPKSPPSEKLHLHPSVALQNRVIVQPPSVVPDQVQPDRVSTIGWVPSQKMPDHVADKVPGQASQLLGQVVGAELLDDEELDEDEDDEDDEDDELDEDEDDDDDELDEDDELEDELLGEQSSQAR